eukprot:CAMPEP_0176456586 /NCGR_PEP_ID=MMETSP0127-20121128/31380_1 /TAXON_ID=938130 /ORGANISM="Platyophrya macrostoma, Strain WH" /LENGTH=109 /DNA_ID=CAMNT_0017846581 /DNA_START=34 /DNA_END=363 /DNA_ORIENTATION=-
MSFAFDLESPTTATLKRSSNSQTVGTPSAYEAAYSAAEKFLEENSVDITFPEPCQRRPLGIFAKKHNTAFATLQIQPVQNRDEVEAGALLADTAGSSLLKRRKLLSLRA